MKRLYLILLSLIISVSVSRSETIDNILLVKINDWDRTISYQLMTPNEYKTLQDNLKRENSLKTEAFNLAEKEWKEKEEHKNIAYPRSVMKIKSARTIKVYENRKKAENRLFKLEDKIQEQLEEEEDERKHKQRYLKGKARIRANKEYAKQKTRELMMKEARDIFMAKVELLKKTPVE